MEADQIIRDSLPAPAECEHNFSPSFQKKMRRIFRRAKHPVVYKLPKYAACFVLIVALASSTWLTVDAEARTAFFAWVREQYETYIEYKFLGRGQADNIDTQYSPTWLPDGFSMLKCNVAPEKTHIIYENDSGMRLTFLSLKEADALSMFLSSDYKEMHDCQSLKESLPYAPIILKVTPVDSPEYFFGGRQQKFCIKEVFSGEDLQIGDEIYITADHWKVYPAEKTMDMGFVNIPQKGTDYLVFLSGSIGYSQHQIEVFRLQSGKYINPIFSYKSYENKIYPTTGEATYVPHSEVSENEFYATESEGIDAFLTLKHQLISLYQ